MVKQMSFLILTPFEHFLRVSNILWSTLVLFNNNVSFTSLSLHTQGCSPSSMYCHVSSIFLICSNIAFTLVIFFTVWKLFPQFFCFLIPCPGSQLHWLHLLHHDFKFCGLTVSTCCSCFLHIRLWIWFFTDYSNRVQSKLSTVSLWYSGTLVHSGILYTLVLYTFWYSVRSCCSVNLLLHCYCFFQHSFSYDQLNKVITVLFFLWFKLGM